MKKLFSILAFSLIAVFAFSQNTIVGTWKTIDDVTGLERSTVKVYKAKNGMYYGKILALHNRQPDEDKDPICEVCPKNDYRHNKKVIGMSIITKMEASSDETSASGGKILDPKNGKIYGCTMEIIEGGAKLKVRGFLGIKALGRNQTWVRVN